MVDLSVSVNFTHPAKILTSFTTGNLEIFVAFGMLQLKRLLMMPSVVYDESLSKQQNVKVVVWFLCFLHSFIFIQLNIYLIGITLTTVILLFCCSNKCALTFCYLCKQSYPPKSKLLFTNSPIL